MRGGERSSMRSWGGGEGRQPQPVINVYEQLPAACFRIYNNGLFEEPHTFRLSTGSHIHTSLLWSRVGKWERGKIVPHCQ